MHNTLTDFVLEYIYLHSKTLGLSPNTIANKRGILVRFMTWLGSRELTLENTQNYFNEMQARGVTANSRKTEIKNVRALLKYLYKKKYIPQDFGIDIIIPKVKNISEKLVSAEIAEQAIILGTEPSINDHAGHRQRKSIMRFALRFALRTGLRGIELKNLRGNDLVLDGDRPYFFVNSKGGNRDRQPAPLDMIDELRLRQQDDYVFPNLCAGTLNDLLKKGAEKMGFAKDIKFDVHMLRKIFGTDIARQLTMSQVSKLMRHSDISITQKFYLSYGLDELSDLMNSAHSLIRLGMPQEEVLENFVQKTALPAFKNDTRFVVSHESNAEKRELVLRISY